MTEMQRIVNRIKLNRYLIKKHPSRKDMLQKAIDRDERLILDTIMEYDGQRVLQEIWVKNGAVIVP